MAQEPGAKKRGAKRLTEAGIQRINAPAKGRIEIADAIVPGLRFRITDRDKRSWSLIYRIAGASRLQQRVTLGNWPAVGVAEARKRAKDALFEAMTGNDPAAEKKKEAERAPDVFEDVAAEFVLRFLKPRQKRWQATEAIIKNKLISRWRGRPIRQITKPDVLKLLDREMDAGRQRMANQSHQLAGQLFRWALRRGYVDQDPTAGVDKPAKDRSRDRVLSDEELAEVWQAASQLGYPFGPFVQLLILTGQRRNEVAGLLWAEIDFDKQLWSLPADRTKNGRPHDIPLSALAMAMLEKMPRLADRIFPSAKKTSERTISGFSKTKRRIDALILEDRKRRAAASDQSLDDVEQMLAWVLHDLRRTAVTGMAELGIQPHVIEAVVNHVSGHKAGVAGVYNRATYAVEKREALNRWAEHVAQLVGMDAGSIADSNSSA